MFGIGVYVKDEELKNQIKDTIRDFLIERHLMAKVSYFENIEHFITTPNSFDLYILDMDAEDNMIQIGEEMTNIDLGTNIIYLGSSQDSLLKAAKNLIDYYLHKPFEPNELLILLSKIKQKIKDDNIVIKYNGGERRVRVNNLNYINIEKRCLCYHLTDGNMFDGQVLRSSFQEAISPLHEHKTFLFLPPSLLINLGEIKEVYKDNIVFENDDKLYFPKKSYDIVRNAWLTYTRILDF